MDQLAPDNHHERSNHAAAVLSQGAGGRGTYPGDLSDLDLWTPRETPEQSLPSGSPEITLFRLCQDYYSSLLSLNGEEEPHCAARVNIDLLVPTSKKNLHN